MSAEGQAPIRWTGRLEWQAGSLLASLPARVRAELLDRCLSRTYRPGEYILRQGDTGDHAVVLLDGIVKIRIVDTTGFSAVMALRQRGDIVGEFGALTGEPRTASVIAATPTRGGVIAGQALSRLLTTHPALFREIIRMQGRRLEWANQRRVDFAALPARRKIAKVLADLATGMADDGLQIHLSQHELASLVGVSLNTAEDGLRHLAKLGLVTRRYRSLLVPHPGRLHEFADSVAENP